MSNRFNDSAEFTTGLSAEVLPISPRQISRADGRSLRRAKLFGQWGYRRFGWWAFEDVEPELRAGWLLAGETVPWRDVREAVRLGFEYPPHD